MKLVIGVFPKCFGSFLVGESSSLTKVKVGKFVYIWLVVMTAFWGELFADRAVKWLKLKSLINRK